MTSLSKQKILFIGGGKMGSAVANAIADNHGASNISVIDPYINAENFSEDINKGASFYNNFEQIEELNFDLIIIAVKPQNFAEVLPSYSKFKDSVFTSIAAGKSIAAIQKIIGEDKKIIRSMPNLPATIGKGVTGLYKSSNISDTEFNIAKEIFRCCGSIVEIQKEEGIDVITAISGSAPGYIFYIMEVFENIIKTYGFSEDEARNIALSNFEGSIKLAQTSNTSFAKLKESVTSKAGTTEAGLNILSTDNVLENLFLNAIDTAHKRAKELSD